MVCKFRTSINKKPVFTRLFMHPALSQASRSVVKDIVWLRRVDDQRVAWSLMKQFSFASFQRLPPSPAKFLPAHRMPCVQVQFDLNLWQQVSRFTPWSFSILNHYLRQAESLGLFGTRQVKIRSLFVSHSDRRNRLQWIWTMMLQAGNPKEMINGWCVLDVDFSSAAMVDSFSY